MKDFKKGLSFGMGIVNAGQRAVSDEPELIVSSTSGSFRITSIVSKALGVEHGGYIMFINNRSNIDFAILNKAPEVVAYCEEAGLDITSAEAASAIHSEFDIWGIAKGIAEYDKNGSIRTTREKMSAKDKIKYVDAYFNDTLESALASDNEELKAALTREGITKEEQKAILVEGIQGDEVQKFKGSKCANTSALSGIGVTLNFTDSNVWNQLKSDLDEESAKSINRVFSVDVDDLQEAVVNDGCKNVTVKVALLTEYKDVKPVRIGNKSSKKETSKSEG